MGKPRVLVFSSGTAVGGGSGFEKLEEATRKGVLQAEILAVVSNHAEGGVYQRAERLGVPFIHFPGPWTAERYQFLAQETGAKFFALSGWVKLVVGLDLKTRFNSTTVFNIHPGPLPQFGGPGLYGHHVHEAVMAAYTRGEITHSAVSMHFVTEPKSRDDYDKGPVFFRSKVKILADDTPESLGKRVNLREHECQPELTNMVVNGLIRWDGVDPSSLEFRDRTYHQTYYLIKHY